MGGISSWKVRVFKLCSSDLPGSLGGVCMWKGGWGTGTLPLSMLQNELSFYILGFLKKKSA